MAGVGVMSGLGVHGKGHLQLCMADHALTQDAEQNGRWGPRPCATRVCWFHVYGKEVLVGEGMQLQEVELALEVGNVTAHWRACHTPPVAHTRIVPQWVPCSLCAWVGTCPVYVPSVAAV